VAAVALSWDRPGIGWPLTALVLIAAVLAAVHVERRGTLSSGVAPGGVVPGGVVPGGVVPGGVVPGGVVPGGTRSGGVEAGGVEAGGVEVGRVQPGRAVVRIGWAVAAWMLLAVGAVRAAGWLFVLCVLTAGLAGCLALTDRRSVGGVLLAPLRVAGALPAALRWLVRGGIRVRGRDRNTLVRTLVAGLIAMALLLVFGFLLAWGDAAFAHAVSTMVSSLDGGTVLRGIWSAAVAVAVTAVAAYLLLTRASVPEKESRAGLVRRIEWALTVGGLVVLFAGFVTVQARVLFGGRAYVEATTGLTYAQYARGGFWQLLAVTMLTVIVISVVARIAPRSAVADRVLLRALLGLLSALALVIVASALSRMAAYEQAYGFTRQRLLVTACELWLGTVFLLILIAGIRLRGRWVPEIALATAVAALLGLAVLNPDAFIARQHIARFAETGRIDVDYLRTLSPDAVPALQSLPEPYRSCALAAIDIQLAESRPEAWLEWNLGRNTAKAQLHHHPPAPYFPFCPL
jgi:hypothetical protein